jgi:hypothetical protein
MVKLVRILVMSGALLLPLVSCQVLFMGIFPSTVGQMSARADLTAVVPAGPASGFTLTTVTANSFEYVLLFTASPFDNSQVHLVVLDPHLKVLNQFTQNALYALSGSTAYLGGTAAMVDVNDKVVVGNFRFLADTSGLSFAAVNPVALYSPSVRGRPQYTRNEVNFQLSGGLLTYNEYSSGWSFNGTRGNIPIGVPSPPPQAQLNLLDVMTDPNSAVEPDLFLFQDGGSQRTYFLQVPKSDINSDLGAVIPPAPDLFTYAAANYPPLVVKSNLSMNGIGFSRAGIVAYDQGANALVHFTLDAPDSVSSLPLKSVSGLQVAAGMDGTYCVVWDPNTRSLTRYEQWW